MGLRAPQEISAELQQRFDHGNKNEINAVATFISTFLQVFYPEHSFYEEGCYTVTEDGKTVLLVSPNGSIRSDDAHIAAGVEIKCPFPGKKYSTPVHYQIPHYYVPQILSEMHCLGVDNLFFLSYSPESMTILQALFDEDLWRKIHDEITIVNTGGLPKKLSENRSSLKAGIDKYRQTHVTLVAEVTSKLVLPCTNHTDCSRDRIYHEKPIEQDTSYEASKLEKVIQTCIKCESLIEDCCRLCAKKATEVLVFLLADLDRAYKPEIPHAFPIAYALKGYSMNTETMRKMLRDVLLSLFVRGLYTPVVAFDGQWAKLAFQSSTDEPLTLLQLQRKVYAEVKSKSIAALRKQIFETGVVTPTSMDDLMYSTEMDTGAISASYIGQRKLFRPTMSICKLIDSPQSNGHGGNGQTNECHKDLSAADVVVSSIPSDVLCRLEEQTILQFQDVTLNVGSSTMQNSQHATSGNENLESLFATPAPDDSSETPNAFERDKDETSAMKPDESVFSTARLSDALLDERRVFLDTIIQERDIDIILGDLQSSSSMSGTWNDVSVHDFIAITDNKVTINQRMTKGEILVCLETIRLQQPDLNVTFFKSWKKQRLVDLLFDAFSATSPMMPSGTKTHKSPSSLINLCKRVIKKIPKSVLNAVVAEYEFLDRVAIWNSESPFHPVTMVNDIGGLSWFSKPEYIESTMSYLFSFLDVHHLITNCRVKVCKDGFPERKICRQAWIDVARENKTKLKVSHVEDLVDKQSDAIARETFSLEVESSMRKLGYEKEAEFCKLVREFYEAEDEPGICAVDRCRRRLELKEWLLDGVNFCNFPPYGSHIRGIPNVMFQGFLTNIERRIQLFPYVKCGVYNVRSLGSLEAENFFGEFQDLDPKGSGVIKAEEIPVALESACQLLRTRLMPDRPFHMSLTQAKVYPVHELMEESGRRENSSFLYPTYISEITVRDHMFDVKARAKRKAQRKLATIAEPDSSARGTAPVRQHHKCDESKIPAHKRLGIEL